jgi:hypothetical protein
MIITFVKDVKDEKYIYTSRKRNNIPFGWKLERIYWDTY